MSDIRRTGLLDNFNRADEDPLSDGGKWSALNTADHDFNGSLLLHNHEAQGRQVANQHGYGSFWNPETFDGDVEIWGSAIGGANPGEAWRLMLMNDPGTGASMDGYFLECQPGSPNDGVAIARFDNGTPTQLAQILSPSQLAIPELFLLRTNGTSVEAWASTDSGANWTMLISAIDNTYRTDLSLVLATKNASSAFPHWGRIGGGIPRVNKFIPQQYRRQLGVA